MQTNRIRRQRETSEMRLRIIDAARELFVSGGENAVTLRGVAERIEYSATTIYLYFPNKESLIRELCLADFALYSRTLIQADRTVDPVIRLRKIAAAYIDFGLLYPSHYRAMFMTPAGLAPIGKEQSNDQSPRAVQQAVSTLKSSVVPASPYDYLHTAVFKAMAAGCFRPQYREVALVAQIIWSGLHGLVSLHLVRSRHAAVNWRPVQTAAETMVECLVDGLTNNSVGSAL